MPRRRRVQIGPHKLDNNVVLAPMAGVTDLPFRLVCRALGAGLAVSEMVSSNSLLRGSRKTRLRLDHAGERAPVAVQILGSDPCMMAEAARYNVDNGAQIIDINMGCPAKKVCNVLAGSALLRDETLVAGILERVVNAVDVPVTLKMRTGWDPSTRNALRIALLAEQAGIQALAVHGRTRACGYRGEAEYATISEVKAAVKIPVLANGDIGTPERAREVLERTGADGVMIGRAAQGNPWIFREVAHFLEHGRHMPPVSVAEVRATLLAHLESLYGFYGDGAGVRVARKHLAWYSRGRAGGAEFRVRVNRADCAREQVGLAREFFAGLERHEAMAA